MKRGLPLSIPALSLRTWAATVLEGIDSSVSCPWPGIGEGRMKCFSRTPVQQRLFLLREFVQKGS